MIARFMLLLIGMYATAVWSEDSAHNDHRDEQPITIMVSGPEGGAADQLTRAVAQVIAGHLERRLIVENVSGGPLSGKGMEDSTTWSAGSLDGLFSPASGGSGKRQIRRYYITFAVPQVCATAAGSPYRDLDELISALRSRSRSISLALPGGGAREQDAGRQLAEAAEAEVIIRSFSGGPGAFRAAIGNEADLTIAASVDLAVLLRAGMLTAPAVFASRPLSIEGYGTIPPISGELAGLEPQGLYYGIFLPPTAPAALIEKLDAIWRKEIRNSRELREFAARRGLLYNPLWGQTLLPAAPFN